MIIHMTTVLEAGDGISMSSDLAGIGRSRVVGGTSGPSTEFVTDFESRFQLQLLSLGIITSDHESSGAENIARSAPQAAVAREQIFPIAYRSGEAAPNPAGKDIALTAPCDAVETEDFVRHPRACDVEASVSHKVRPKKSNKAEPEVQGSAEVKEKRSSSQRLNTQEFAKQDAPAPATLLQGLDSKTESVPSAPTRRTANPEMLERQIDPSTLFPGVEQPEANAGALSNREAAPQDATELEVPSKALPSGNVTEAKSFVTVATDHSVVESPSAKAIALVEGDRAKYSVPPESSGAFTASRSRNSNSSSVLELVSSSSIPAKHSQSRNADPGRHLPEGRAESIGMGTVLAGDICRNPLAHQPKDQAIPGIQRHTNQSTLEIMDGASRNLDLPLKHPEQQWIHVGPRLAEAGFQDDSLGWVSVRAARDSSGLHAVLVPPSAEAARTLSGHLNGLNAYLGNSQIPVSAVTLSTFQDGRQGSSTGANAQQQSARDGCDDRNGERQKDAFTAEITSVSTRARSQSDLDRYESLSMRLGNFKSEETHISLVA